MKFVKAWTALKELQSNLKKRNIDLDFGIDTFNDRLILQKMVFILQEFNIDLNYPFNWYMHGPYSPELASDAFNYLPILEKKLKNNPPINFKNSEQKKIIKVAQLISEAKTNTSMDETLLLEAISSLIYLIKYVKSDSIEMLIKLKPKFSKYKEELEEIRAILKGYLEHSS